MPEESTTPDPVELVRLFFDVMDRDFDWDAVKGFFAPDAVMDSGRSLATYEGRDAIGAFLRDYWSTWEEHHHSIQEVVDLGHGLTVVSVHEDGRIVGSDARIGQQNAWVFEWAAGKITRLVPYSSFDEARAAAERLANERE
jgi:ketosteroid isomerase-like protein